MYPLLRRLLSTLFGLPPMVAVCRHAPTCSQYCYQIIKQRGLVRGAIPCLRRLLSCHP